ncbi:MFS transporter [Rhodovibrio salinarum]|uniref:MFS transporter n=1 Tax=Rhodovibrio salinarum TaxID=1087 RepID=UPI0004B40D07|nr:MFS transporter [Rhodovibrio salinarum]
MSVARITAVMCVAQLLGMLSNASFPALIPTFVDVWDLSGATAGWVAGMYYAGYVAAVPLLVAYTDRLDARAIYLTSQLLGLVAAAGFALFAAGPWSASALRFFDGIALAGTYMVGARMLSDRAPGSSRALAFYTATFSFATAVSVFAAGEISTIAGWPSAFWLGAVGHGLAAVLVLVSLRPRPPAHAPRAHPRDVLDPRPVLRNAPAMAYILSYAAHIWEMFGFRTWLVAFLGFAFVRAGAQADAPSFAGLTPTQIATVLLLLGMPASILGNEAAVRFGRRRVLKGVMASSGLLACALGVFALGPVWLLLAACALYGVLMMADSAALTAGTVAAAASDRRGATMALHSLLGFGAGVVGPAVSGVALDIAGGPDRPVAWGAAFVVLGLGGLLGPVILSRLGRQGDPADPSRSAM